MKKISYLPGLSFTHPFYINQICNNYFYEIYSSSLKSKFFINSNGKYIFSPMFFKIFTRITKSNYGLRQKYMDIKFYNKVLNIRNLDTDIIHANALFAYGAYTNKKNQNVFKILEEQNSSITFCNDLLTQEYRKFGLNYNFDERLVQQRIKEYNMADKILVPSSYSLNSFLNYGYEKKNFYKFMSINTRYLKLKPKKTKTNEKITFGYIGGNLIMKGLIYLLKSLNKVEYDHCLKLTLNLSQISQIDIIKKSFDKNKMFCLGAFKNMDDFYKQIDVLVVPSINDGFAMVVFEAISRCVPVIVSSNVGASEYLDNRFGEKFEAGNQDELDFIIREKINTNMINCYIENIKKNFNSFLKNFINQNNSIINLYSKL